MKTQQHRQPSFFSSFILKPLLMAFFAIVLLLLANAQNWNIPYLTNLLYPIASPLPGINPVINVISNRQHYQTTNLKQMLPTQVATYQTSPVDLTLEAPRIARIFGMAATPKLSTDADGQHYTWTKDDFWLKVGGDPLVIAYTAPQTNQSKVSNHTEIEFDQAAKSLIGVLNLIPDKIELSILPFQYVSAAKTASELEPSTREQANRVIVRYKILLDNLPVFKPSGNETDVIVALDSQKQVVYFFGRFYPSLTKSDQINSLLSLSSAQAQIAGAKGTLISIQLKNPPENFLEGQILHPGQIKILSAELSYHYIANEQRLIPVYLFKGEAIDTVTNQTLETVTLLPASVK